jgi:hypothetical protein
MSYTITWSGRTITGYTGTLPATLDLSTELNPSNETALEIASSAFQNNTDITAVIFGNDLTTIQTTAFGTCTNLQSITFGTGLTYIGIQAFLGCDILSLVIPNSVTNMDYGAFDGNVNLRSLIIGTGLSSISATCFRSSKSGQSNISSVTIPNNITKIESQAFAANTIEFLDLGNGITTIEDFAFFLNNINGLSLPNSLSNIGIGAFQQNFISSLVLPNNLLTLGESSFANNPNLSTLVLGNGLTSIKDASFYNCGIQSLELTNNISSIGNEAFFVNKISSIVIPNNVTSLGFRAFQDNPNLVSVNFGTGLTTLSTQIFMNCSISSLTLPNNISLIQTEAFSNNPFTLATIQNFPGNVNIEANAFDNDVSIIYTGGGQPPAPTIIPRPLVYPTSMTFTVNSNADIALVSSLNIQINGPGGGVFGFKPPPYGWYRYTINGLTSGCNYTSAAYLTGSNQVSSAQTPFRSVYTGNKPSEVQNLTGNVIGSSVTLGWNAPSSSGGAPLLGYMIRDLVQNSNYNVPFWTTSYTAPLLVPGSNLFSLEAVNDPGYSSRVYWSTITV